MNPAGEGFTDTLVALKNRLPEITDKDRIENAISNTRKAIHEQIEPTMDDLESFFSETQPTSKYGKEFVTKVMISANIRNQADWFRGVRRAVEVVTEHLDTIQAEVSKGFAKRMVTEAASFRELNILGYVNVLSQFIDRLMKVFYTTVMEEASTLGTRKYRPSRGSMMYAMECLTFTTSAMVGIFANAKDLSRAIRTLADVEVTEETEEMLRSSRPLNATNLLASGFLASRWNIFFSIYKYYVEHQVNTYNRRKEERQVLQLTLQQVREDREGMTNGEKAKIQRWIETLEDRIERLDAKITNFEKEYEIEAQ